MQAARPSQPCSREPVIAGRPARALLQRRCRGMKIAPHRVALFTSRYGMKTTLAHPTTMCLRYRQIALIHPYVLGKRRFFPAWLPCFPASPPMTAALQPRHPASILAHPDGCIMLAEGNESGLDHLATAARADRQLAQAAAQIGFAYLEKKYDGQRAEQWSQQLLQESGSHD